MLKISSKVFHIFAIATKLVIYRGIVLACRIIDKAISIITFALSYRTVMQL